MSASPATRNVFPTNTAIALRLKLHHGSWHLLFFFNFYFHWNFWNNILFKGKLYSYGRVENITSILLNYNYATQSQQILKLILSSACQRLGKEHTEEDDQTVKGSSGLDLAHWPKWFSFKRKGATTKQDDKWRRIMEVSVSPSGEKK